MKTNLQIGRWFQRLWNISPSLFEGIWAVQRSRQCLSGHQSPAKLKKHSFACTALALALLLFVLPASLWLSLVFHFFLVAPCTNSRFHRPKPTTPQESWKWYRPAWCQSLPCGQCRTLGGVRGCIWNERECWSVLVVQRKKKRRC